LSLYWLHKVQPLIFLPTGIIIGCLLLALVVGQRRYVVVALVLLLVCSNHWVERHVVKFTNGEAIHAPAATLPVADAIVVLSEGREIAPGNVSEWIDSDRFWGGIDCYAAKRAPLLVFTGGTAPYLPTDPLEGTILAAYAQRLGVPPQHILVSPPVLTTAEEAQAVARLLKEHRPELKHIILVTSAFHMARAQSLFTKAGFEVSTYPVDFRIDANEQASLEDWLPTARSFARTEMMIRELEGRWYYRWLH
jgi:uncharacterized SAM-binding protein YcdF (DUF218 family)